MLQKLNGLHFKNVGVPSPASHPPQSRPSQSRPPQSRTPPSRPPQSRPPQSHPPQGPHHRPAPDPAAPRVQRDSEGIYCSI